MGKRGELSSRGQNGLGDDVQRHSPVTFTRTRGTNDKFEETCELNLTCDERTVPYSPPFNNKKENAMAS